MIEFLSSIRVLSKTGSDAIFSLIFWSAQHSLQTRKKSPETLILQIFGGLYLHGFTANFHYILISSLHSKSGSPHGLVGSNPTSSAIQNAETRINTMFVWVFLCSSYGGKITPCPNCYQCYPNCYQNPSFFSIYKTTVF